MIAMYDLVRSPGNVARPTAIARRRSHVFTGFRRYMAAIGLATGLAIGTSTPGHADTAADAPASPFPDTAQISSWYTPVDPGEFVIPDHPGVWFLTPSGLSCGIWPWGSFGCAGDIPGAPPGDTHIAWFNGNRSVHHGWTAAIQFPAGQAQRPLPVRSFITYESTTCAITPEGNTYCGHGEFKLLITPQGTWFKVWDDRRSYVCNYYNSCPPG